MRFKNSTALLSVSFAALTAAPAMADITADDIWAGYQAITKTIGAELTATTTRDGNKVEFTDTKLHIVFPDDTFSADILYPTLTFTENADGTVSLDLDKPLIYKFVFTGVDEAQVSAEVLAKYDNAELIASGTPGDITFSYAMDGAAIEVQNLAAKDELSTHQPEISITGSTGSVNGTSRLSLDDLVTISGQVAYSSFGYDVNFKDESGDAFSTAASYGKTTSETTLSLPTGGMSIMNLAAAFQQGLSLETTTNYDSSSVQTIVISGGEEVSSQSVSGGATVVDISANTSAIELSAEAVDIGFEMPVSNEIPVAIKADIDQLVADFSVPISASEGPQDFTIALGYMGIMLNEDIWALFDPAEILPRDAATVSMNLTGKTTLLQDLLNFTEMMQLSDGDVPLELNALTIKEFLVSAAGASLSATGDFAFNNDDLTSFDGLPAPIGSADVQVSGANGLIDKLIEMGLIADSDAMGARMMMGMLAVPGEGEDSLKSTLEITEDGQILANGQRIK